MNIVFKSLAVASFSAFFVYGSMAKSGADISVNSGVRDYIYAGVNESSINKSPNEIIFDTEYNKLTNVLPSKYEAAEENDEESADEARKEVFRKAIEYLKNSANSDGSYNEGYGYNTTVEVCFVLDNYSDYSYDPAYSNDTGDINGLDYSDGSGASNGSEVVVKKSLEWLSKQKYKNNIDSLSRYILVSKDKKALMNLFKKQNNDGGFGITDEYTSDVVDSLLVLEAANIMPSKKYSGNVKRLVKYICDQCDENGAYSFTDGGKEDVILTARVLSALIDYRNNYPDDNNSINSTIDTLTKYIEKNYIDDFSEEGIEKSLYALIALRKARADMDFDGVVEILKAKQSDNGGLYDSVRLTALSIRFLGEYENDNDEKSTTEKDESDTEEDNSDTEADESDTGSDNSETESESSNTERDESDSETGKTDNEMTEDSEGNTGSTEDKTDSDTESTENKAEKDTETTANNTENNTGSDEDKTKSNTEAGKDDSYGNHGTSENDAKKTTEEKEHSKTSDSFNGFVWIMLYISLVMIPLLMGLNKRKQK
ncbi:Prenyltransferase and squalene oxidase repeat-containing protein [Eubacterium ruminantium]|nr:Prenyltransferase and squalene oxidase repeat-containing protein [Eubacterium ruminantium]